MMSLNNVTDASLNISSETANLLRSLRMNSQKSSNQLSCLSSLQSLSTKPFMLNNIKTIPSMSSTMSSVPLNIKPDTRKVYSVEDKDDLLVHLLWNCGEWTSSYHKIDNGDLNLFITPNIAVIEPKNIINLDKLSKVYSEPIQYQQPPLLLPTNSFGSTNSSTNGSVGTSSFGSIFSANSSVSSFDRFDDTMSVSSSFSYNSITTPSSPSASPAPTRASLSSVSNLSNSSNSSEKSLKSFKDYVFFSNRLTSVLQRRLGKKASGLEYQALYQFEARKFQYSILKGDVRIIKDYRNNNNGNDNNNNGPIDYLIFKFGRSSNSPLYAICERNDRHPERQPWCCQHVKSLDEMIKFFGLESYNLKTQESFLNKIKIVDTLVKKTFDTEMDYNSNVNKITRMLKHGFYDFQKALQRRNNQHNNEYNQYGQSNSRKSRKNKRNGGDSKATKLKNEDKFMYLSAIAHNLQVSIKDLFNILGNAIEDSFLFAREYPETVITQGYIDEERGTLSFELVLEAEIYDYIRNVFYKFAIPIVECENKQTGMIYYEAKNILTPKMAIDNIRLNSINASLNNNTWSIDLNNWDISYYQKIDYMWFNKINILRAAAINYRNNINSINNNKSVLLNTPISLMDSLSRPSSHNIFELKSFGSLKRASIDDSDDNDDNESSSSNNYSLHRYRF